MKRSEARGWFAAYFILFLVFGIIFACIILCRPGKGGELFEGEKHLQNITQLTFGGDNGEAYFSCDGKKLVFQSKRDGREYDAIYIMNSDGKDVKMVSSGEGVTTCGFISPDGKSIIYASTHLGENKCPAKPDMSQGYVWPLYEEYDIFQADIDGKNVRQLTKATGYDAEGVYSPKGDKILFTSARTSDLELWLMNPDGSDQEQLTDIPGYDGGAFFSPNGEWICWRAARPQGKEYEDYRCLLGKNLIRPGKLEIYIMNLKERKPIQLTDNGAANFAPYFHPSGKKVIFSSNLHNPRGHNFDLFTVDVITGEIEQITFSPSFDGFPMFSYNGEKLVFSSNRGGETGETNIFIADWKD